MLTLLQTGEVRLMFAKRLTRHKVEAQERAFFSCPNLILYAPHRIIQRIEDASNVMMINFTSTM